MTFLLMDFGASRIKSGISHDGEPPQSCDIGIYAACAPETTRDGKYEVSGRDLQAITQEIIGRYRKTFDLDGILICSEMHGFALLDENDRPCSNYVSWKDERDAVAGGAWFKSLTARIAVEEFLRITGMTCSPSSPVVNLCCLLKDEKVGRAKVVSLPELLVAVSGQPTHVTHVSMAAGIGVVDINRMAISERVMGFVRDETGTELTVNEVACGNLEPAGTIMGIPVYAGVGDMQAALLGAGNDETTISLNLGTGSQVSCINGKTSFPGMEKRPFFDGRYVDAITHIPSGRMLNAYLGFLSSVNPSADFWGMLADCTPDEIGNAPLSLDLGVFRGAWNFTDGGCIRNIMEGNFTVRTFLASLLNSYVRQYETCIRLFSDRDRRSIVLSGGIPGKLPALGRILAARTGLRIRDSKSREETLDGLARLSKSLQ